MSKCPNCFKEANQTFLKNECMSCGYPHPVWTSEALIVTWVITTIIMLLASALLSKFFLIIVFFQTISVFTTLKKRKNKPFSPTSTKKTEQSTNQELERHRACFSTNKAKANNFQNIDIDDCISYDSSYFVDEQNEEFKDFKNNLTPIWDEGGYSISFEYANSRGNQSKREILLDKVLINSDDKVYFSGYCFDAAEDRTFKAERIIFPIEYAGQRYSVDRFLTQALGLKQDYVKGLDF